MGYAEAVRKAVDNAAAEVRSGALSPGRKYYVSYAWGDESPEGQKRDQAVEELCKAGHERNTIILRDKEVMRPGDRISSFTRELGAGDRVFILLSDKYLKSTYCMSELFEVYVNCRENDREFIARTRVFLLPCVSIDSAAKRAQYAIYWKERYEELTALIKEHGNIVLSDNDIAAHRRMSRFANETANILQLVHDTLGPRSFDEFLKHGLCDRAC